MTSCPENPSATLENLTQLIIWAAGPVPPLPRGPGPLPQLPGFAPSSQQTAEAPEELTGEHTGDN